MQKTKTYYGVRFSSNDIEEAHRLFLSKSEAGEKEKVPQYLSVEKENESWGFDSIEEFFAEHDSANSSYFDHICKETRFIVDHSSLSSVRVVVAFPSRSQIEAVFKIFEKYVETGKVAIETSPIKIFIGHGHDQQWKDLKDHLREQHGFEVVAYEIGPRAGLSVKEVLERMLDESSIAFLVLTGEDQKTDGEIHARQNVVHELGLFQGKLGFTKAIAVLEDGVKEFSNILGVNQIRFSKGNIKESYGDVLATIKREFE